MNPSAASKGNSFAGAVAYVTHDVGKTSSDRVAHVQTLNMRTADPEKAAKVMAWTAIHAAELKEAAGLKATGRKAGNPVYHFSLNWEPSERPDHKHMVETAKAALAAIGYGEHEAVLAVHRDKEHRHIHVVVNRVHPENGKTHNPQNDYQALQGWAYGYEKAQGKIFCLDRAIKHESNKSLKEEYRSRLVKEQQKGNDRESFPRPQWDPQHDAPGKLTSPYKALRAKFDAKKSELAQAGRDLVKRHADERKELKARHTEERAALWQKQTATFKNRRSFERAASPGPAYTWKAYQADRSQLRVQHARQTSHLRAEQREKNAPDVAAFRAGQKAAWRDFHKLQRADDRGRLSTALKITAATPVSRQTADHRDHLARLFNATAVKGVREERFAAHLDAAKKAFFAGVAEKDAPAHKALKAQQLKEGGELRQKFDHSRAHTKARGTRIEGHRATARQERAELVARHRGERVATTAKHGEEVAGQRQAWASFNQERRDGWGQYKADRARQDRNKEQDKTEGRGVDRTIHARDYARPSGDRSGAGGGREISRKGGPA